MRPKTPIEPSSCGYKEAIKTVGLQLAPDDSVPGGWGMKLYVNGELIGTAAAHCMAREDDSVWTAMEWSSGLWMKPSMLKRSEIPWEWGCSAAYGCQFVLDDVEDE